MTNSVTISTAPAEVKRKKRRNRAGSDPDWITHVPLWLGRFLHAAALLLLIASVPNIVLSESVSLAVSYLDFAWLTPVPALFNAGLLFVLGRGAKLRKRGALWAVVALSLPLIVLGAHVAWSVVTGVNPYYPNLPPGDDPFQATDILAGVAALSLVILLIKSRRAFSSAVLPGARKCALAAIGTGWGIAIGVGWVLTAVAPGNLVNGSQRWYWLVNTVMGSLPNQLILTNFEGYPEPWVSLVVTTISAIGLTAALLLYTRSARSWLRVTAQQELDVRRLLATSPATDSLGYFATRRDKAVVFSPDGKAAVSYGVFSGVALASGDPLGDPARWSAAIDAWTRRARNFGWGTAVVATTERGARAYARAGMSTMVMGEEAVIDTDSFSLAGSGMGSVRAAVRRAESAGYTVLIRRAADVSRVELSTLASLANRWRGSSVERGFSMALGRLGDPSDRRYVVMTATDADGTTRGLLGFVPWGRDGLSLDVMRRAPDAVSGVTELMVSTLARRGPELGVRRISLNFAMFRDALERGERIGAPRMDRIRRRTVLILSRYWQLNSLYRSNAKYLPHWQERYLCHTPGVSQAQAMLTSARAEGFVRLPYRHAEEGGYPSDTARGYSSRPDFVKQACAIDAQAPESQVVRTLTDQQASRLRNLDTLRKGGVDPYPVAVPHDASIEAVVERFGTLPAGARSGSRVSVVGRMVGRRRHGGVAFLDLREGTNEIQAVVDRGRVANADLLIRTTDLCDLLALQGEVITTSRGELTLDVDNWTVAAKSLQTPPGRRTGLVDPESRLRLRHIDIATRSEARSMLTARSNAVRALRDGLLDRRFVEVETPVLQRTHGGANARPFRTHINAYDVDLSLRIAPELALKRLCVGGIGRVFEIGRNFRNEGADATHNPEFTAVEAYQAFADYHTMRELARDLVLEMARAANGSPEGVRPDGRRIRLDIPWPVVTVHEAVSQATGENVTVDTPAEALHAICSRYTLTMPPEATAGHLVSQLYEELVEPYTENPTFYTDFPVETSPLTRRHRHDGRLAERWDLVAFGTEIGTANSELTDPIDQRMRLTQQSIQAAAGDLEAMELDTDFLDALEFGMPPTGGLGMGVDRIMMLLTGAPIRQTLAFPFVQPQTRGSAVT